MYTQDDLDRIEKAIATGVLTVQIGDRSVTYRSIDELIKAKNDIIKKLNEQNSSDSVTVVKGKFSKKGF